MKKRKRRKRREKFARKKSSTVDLFRRFTVNFLFDFSSSDKASTQEYRCECQFEWSENEREQQLIISDKFSVHALRQGHHLLLSMSIWLPLPHKCVVCFPTNFRHWLTPRDFGVYIFHMQIWWVNRFFSHLLEKKKLSSFSRVTSPLVWKSHHTAWRSAKGKNFISRRPTTSLRMV